MQHLYVCFYINNNIHNYIILVRILKRNIIHKYYFLILHKVRHSFFKFILFHFMQLSKCDCNAIEKHNEQVIVIHAYLHAAPATKKKKHMCTQCTYTKAAKECIEKGKEEEENDDNQVYLCFTLHCYYYITCCLAALHSLPCEE